MPSAVFSSTVPPFRFFAVADTYDFYFIFISAEKFAHRFRLRLYSTSGGFLNEYIPAFAVFERKKN